MRRALLCAVLCAYATVVAAETPAKAAKGGGAKLTGDPEALALVERVIKAMGGDEGLEKRRQLYMEQEMQVFNVPVSVCMWIKGEKQRIEQRMGNVAGAAVVFIFDGKKLFVLQNGQKRDPGKANTETFLAEHKRNDIWWDCRSKPLAVKSLGTKKLKPYEKAAERELALLEFTHPDKDTTTVGIDPATSQPVYVAYRGPHPQTGALVPWSYWLGDFAPIESAGNLVFPRTVELYQDAMRMTTAKLISAKTPPQIPDSLFADDATRPVD